MNNSYDLEQGLLNKFPQDTENILVTVDDRESKQPKTITNSIVEHQNNSAMTQKLPQKDMNLKPGRTFDCQICFQSVHIVQKMPLPCDHDFCRACFESFVRQMIQEKRIRKLMCPYDGCDNEITEDFINGLSKELGQAYLYAKQFISPNLRRCVGKDCDKFLEGSTENPHLICECGGEVCFNCGAEWHPNYTCEQFLEEELKNDPQKENVKLCPQCKIRVMKIEGCDHITCYVCKSEWCWICLVSKQEGHAPTCKHHVEQVAEAILGERRQQGACKCILFFILQIVMGTVMCALLPFAIVLYCLGWPAFLYCFDKIEHGSRPNVCLFILLFFLGMLSVPLIALAIPLAVVFLIIAGIVGLGALAMHFCKLPAIGF